MSQLIDTAPSVVNMIPRYAICLLRGRGSGFSGSRLCGRKGGPPASLKRSGCETASVQVPRPPFTRPSLQTPNHRRKRADIIGRLRLHESTAVEVHALLSHGYAIFQVHSLLLGTLGLASVGPKPSYSPPLSEGSRPLLFLPLPVSSLGRHSPPRG